MKRFILFIMVTVFLGAMTAQAAIIYSTYPSSTTYTADWNITNTVIGQQGGEDVIGSDMAAKFIIESSGPNYYLDSIKMYIKDAKDVTSDFLTLAISGHDSTNNIPNTSAYTLSPTDFTNNIPDSYTLVEFNPAARPILQAGNTHWLIASVRDETAKDLLYYWTSNNSLSVSSYIATRSYSSDWDDQAYWPLAFQIHGTEVPIPGAVWLLGSGLIGLVAIRRRMRK
jgi:hypothetical protein